MLKKFILIFILFFLKNYGLFAGPVLEIHSYLKSMDFTDKKIVLFKKGDNPQYKNFLYPDKSWRIISLPFSWYGLYPGYSGICWFRIHIKMPPTLPQKSIGIKLGTIVDANEVFFNSQLIGSSGRFPPKRQSSYDKKRIYEIPTNLIKPGKINILAIRVAGLFPKENGPSSGEFKIKFFQELQEELYKREFFDLIFIIIYLVVAVYFAIIFSRKFLNKEYLFFSLFSLCSTIYLFLRTQFKYLLFDNFYILKKIEYLLLFSILLLMMEFFTYYFRKKHSFIHFIYYFIISVSSILVLVSNEIYFWYQVLLFVIEPTWLIPLAYSIYILLKGYKEDSDTKYVLGAFPVLWLIFINDVMVDRRVYDFIRLSNYGFFIVILGITVIMRNRLYRLQDEVQGYRSKIPNKTPITEESINKMDEAIHYLKTNYASDISRENLASSLGINPDYFGRVFMEYKGKKISEYLNEIRIEKAIEFLKEDKQNVTDIAFSVGFESLSTFYRVFQKIMGESPQSFKTRIRK